jgi:hypothetical protein
MYESCRCCGRHVVVGGTLLWEACRCCPSEAALQPKQYYSKCKNYRTLELATDRRQCCCGYPSIPYKTPGCPSCGYARCSNCRITKGYHEIKVNYICRPYVWNCAGRVLGLGLPRGCCHLSDRGPFTISQVGCCCFFL